MQLDQIQKDFLEGIFGGDKTAATGHVKGDDTLTAEQRFGIYKGSVHGILVKTLELTYPVCKELVGEKFFTNMCKVFIDKYPPTTSFFSEYGDLFPSFLSTFEHVKDLPYITDLASLEWARNTVWHETNNETIDYELLSTLAAEQQATLTFKLSSTLRLIQSKFRIDDICFSHQENSEIELENINLNEPVKLFVWKDKDTIKISLMSADEEANSFWEFLQAISEGTTLGNLAEQFGENLPELLEQGFQGGWIQSFST